MVAVTNDDGLLKNLFHAILLKSGLRQLNSNLYSLEPNYVLTLHRVLAKLLGPYHSRSSLVGKSNNKRWTVWLLKLFGLYFLSMRSVKSKYFKRTDRARKLRLRNNCRRVEKLTSRPAILRWSRTVFGPRYYRCTAAFNPTNKCTTFCSRLSCLF